MDRIDKTRYVLALVAVLAIIAAIMVLSNSDRVAQPMAINGDQLGMEQGELPVDYQQRATHTLEDATDPAFALVTFDRPLSPDTAGALLDQADLSRVSAALTDLFLPVALPEPTEGHSRGDVLKQQLANNGDTGQIQAVVVHDNGEKLRTLSRLHGVFAVEALPADAAWGRFGIRPVQVG